MRAETEGRGVFDSIYEANIETIYLTAKRYTRNHHAAEEIAQDTFLKLFGIWNIQISRLQSRG